MDEQDYTFQAMISVNGRDALTRRLLEAMEGLSAQDTFTIIEALRKEVETTFGLSWSLDEGTLSGNVTIQVPSDYDLEDPLTEESVVVNHQESVASDFETMIVDRIAAIRGSQR